MAHYKGASTEATRALHLMKKRERALEELEEKKKKIEGSIKISTIDNKFSAHNDSIEAQLRNSTVGLVTLDQMRQKQEIAVKEREKQLAQKQSDDSNFIELDVDKNKSKSATKEKQAKSLSFYDDDEDDDDDEDGDDNNGNVGDGDDCSSVREVGRDAIEGEKPDETVTQQEGSSISSASSLKSNKQPSISDVSKKPKFDPTNLDIDTTFLPDRDREAEERRLRELLASEWRERQQKLKEEEIEITFSYWDGSGHRRIVRMKKGNSIYQFLQACLDVLRKDFNELRSISADQLMYVKEDLIIPHHYTFYDFIVTKARGKSGPLFSFDVHEDVRLIADASVEKDESHAGKVLLRSWYERNKHIFPASRWEPYDPSKTYDKYTISDKRIK